MMGRMKAKDVRRVLNTKKSSEEILYEDREDGSILVKIQHSTVARFAGLERIIFLEMEKKGFSYGEEVFCENGDCHQIWVTKKLSDH